MKKNAKAQREELERVLEGRQRAVAASIARRNTLLLRQALIGLMARCLAEIAEHKRRFGFDDGEEMRQLEPFRLETGLDATTTDSGGGGSTSSGGSGGGCGEAGGRDGSGGCSAGGGLWTLNNRSGGGSLLQLERVTREDVDFCRTATSEQAAARLGAVIKAGVGHLAAARGGGGSAMEASPAGGADAAAAAAAAAAAREALAAVYDGIVRYSFLLSIWQPDVFMRVNTQCFVSGQEVSGEADAPQEKWDELVKDTSLSMEQALLLLDTKRLANARFARVGAERAALLAELAELRAGWPGASAAAGGAGGASGGGRSSMSYGSGGGAAACTYSSGGSYGSSGSRGSMPPEVAGDWGDARAAELVERLAATTRAERDIYISSSHAIRAILTPEQITHLMCAAYPWPVHAPKCIQAVRNALALDPRGAFPWAGPPAEVELAELLRDLMAA